MDRCARPRTARDDAGSITVVFAICAVLIFIMCALVVDLGLARDTRRNSQNASDASALAAANAIYAAGIAPNVSAGLSTAKTYARTNFGVASTAWASCTDAAHLAYTPDAPDTCISFDDATHPMKVRVVMPVRNVATGLGALAGVQSIPISSAARAVITGTPGQPCGLCLLGELTHNFQNGDVTVSGADIYLNGSSDVSSKGLVSTTGHIYVENSASGPLSSYQPDPTTNVPPIVDPLASITLPPDMSMLSPSPRATPAPKAPASTQAKDSTTKPAPSALAFM